MWFVDYKSWCVPPQGNWQGIREEALGVSLWLPHQKAIKLLQYVESQKDNTCSNILATILFPPSWQDSSSHDHFFISGSLQGESLGPVLSNFSKGLVISLLFLLYTVLGTFGFMKFLCCILWCQRFRDRRLKLFSSTYWLQAIMGRLFSLSQVMMGRRKVKRNLWSFHQKRCQLTFHLAVKTPSWLLNKIYTYFWILDLITALLCLCLHLRQKD